VSAAAVGATPLGQFRGLTLPTYVRSIVDQLRLHATSPMAIFSTLAMPCVFAFVVHTNMAAGAASRDVTSDMAVGSAGIGMLDAIIVLVVISLMGEKQWKTLHAALGSPSGLVPVVLGRLTGTAIQSLTALPGTLLILVLFLGVDGNFSWFRWLVGGVVLAVATASVVGLLGFAILRFPYSAGMTNGLTSLVLALSALLVPQSALPGPVQRISLLLPQSHVMDWVRGASLTELLVSLGLTVVYSILIVLLIRRIEYLARRSALSLEV
jgi:ABC-type polysaccharide/polyol phosphate export permease